MSISDFIVPCGLLLFTVFVSFLLMCWFFQATYIRSLRQRVQRLEYLIAPPQQHTTDDVVRISTPRPSRPNRYITVDRAPKAEYYR